MCRCLFVCFVALRPKIYGHCGTVSSPNHTFSWASLNKQLTSTILPAHTFACNSQQPFLNDSAEGRRMTVEIIHDQSPRKYGTGPGSNSRPLDLRSDWIVARHVTNYATWPGVWQCNLTTMISCKIHVTWCKKKWEPQHNHVHCKFITIRKNFIFMITFFISWWGEGGSKYNFKPAFTGQSAEKHSNDVALVSQWWPNIECWLMVALWFSRGSGPVLLRNPIFLWFFRRGPDPLYTLWICAC